VSLSEQRGHSATDARFKYEEDLPPQKQVGFLGCYT
jgi:hypothetical protein